MILFVNNDCIVGCRMRDQGIVFVRDQEGRARYRVLLLLLKSMHTSAGRQHCMMAVIYRFSKELMPVAYIEPNECIEAFNDEEVVWLRVKRRDPRFVGCTSHSTA